MSASTEQTEVMSGECLWSDIGASAPGFWQSQGGRNPPQLPPPSSPAPGQSLVASIPRSLSAAAAPRRCSRQVLEQMDGDHQSYSKTLP